MLRPGIIVTPGDLVDGFAAAAPDDLAEPFARLVEATWAGGQVTAGALSAVRRLGARFAGLDPHHQGHVAILFGLLLEARRGDGLDAVHTVIADGFDQYLRAWPADRDADTLFFPLLYLLAHFPGRRAEVLAAPGTGVLDRDDRSRLDRALASLDEKNPDVGRAFPYPAAWELNEDERDFDRAWIDRLGPQELQAHWDNDTETVLGHLGAKAYWALLHGSPVPFVPTAEAARAGDAPGRPAPGGLFGRHAEALRCPHCHGRMSESGDAMVCAGCARSFPVAEGILNLTGTGAPVDRSQDFLFKLAEMPTMGYFYETYARPNFLRLCGANWNAGITPAVEDAYIAEQVRPVDGPVLDLAAGAGRWTSVLAEHVGADRLIALDLGLPMLAALRERLPAVPAVLGGADVLPFGDATLGAVMCWNALQAFPAQAPAAIREVGRCLRPGGTFTLLTFRNSPDPVYRYFVGRHHFPQHAAGLHLFDYDDILRWIADAGLTIQDERTPGMFVIMTAVRAG
ncbi:methyltransferase domain-containing protein [Actinoplanes siamensis]|uniref:Methyltransferase domain-containing protein n=1 Tax=Actinoplanes siamensis TaxID=1223317 RepID=A0A919TLW1_9ACTN|nr:methyltransferase domain-containing protein [Actinoplanes siamensis]GIF07027.1 hypothetical protein Asi03nite_45650 [Actinoplanes siamensis]